MTRHAGTASRGAAGTSPATERRSHARIKTLREALFEAVDGKRPWRTGVAQDISLCGLLIRTFHPENAGTYLEIELAPKRDDPASQAVRVRGQVVRATPLEDGAFAMGVRLRVPPLRRRTSLALLPEPDRMVRDIARVIGTLHGGSLFPLALAEQACSGGAGRAACVPLERDEDHGGRRLGRWLPLLGLLLLFLLLFGAQPTEMRLRWAAHPGTPRSLGNGAFDEGLAGSDNASRGTGGTGEHQAVRPPTLARRVLPAYGRAGYPVDAPNVRREGSAAGRPAPQYVADLRYASDLAAQGDSVLALAVAGSVLSQSEQVPDAWRAIAIDLRDALLTSGAGPVRVEPFQPAVVLQRAPFACSSPELAVVVDRQSYVLTVLRGGAPVWAFPVGLGKDETTPAGEFRIANKIRHPDWYNRGEPVPAGDARNPLGACWMGLGVDGRATSYGIHPTDDPDSIGGNSSRGCIRMRPKDAEALFGLCPVGTPVRICD